MSDTTAPLPFGKRILIAVPHPDDEVVAFACAVRRAQREGAVIFAIYLTNGCIARETLWPWKRKDYQSNVIRRLQESVAVARQMQITPLSYTDRPARHLWRNMPKVYAEIDKAISDHAIDQLWIPAYEGGNADHDGLNGLCRHFKDSLSVLEFAAYNYNKGKTMAQTFPAPNETETTIILSDFEAAWKLKLLEVYASEQQNLGYVGTRQECFRPLADYNYASPPHEGTLWYTRFHWVPFRHPRIDFSKPAQVSEAITSFKK